MIIQWTNWAFFQPTPQSNMTFQVVLNQNGDIDFFYQSLSHPPNPRRATGNSATIGLENANGTQAVLHSFQMGGMADPGGVVNTMPKFAALFVFFAMANSGLPATSGFVGEFMVILGAIKANFWLGFLAATTLILGAAYTLWTVSYTHLTLPTSDLV